MELALWIQDEHDHITTWVREMDKESRMDKTKFAVGNLLDQKPLDPALEHDDWENEGGSSLK